MQFDTQLIQAVLSDRINSLNKMSGIGQKYALICNRIVSANPARIECKLGIEN